MVMPCAPSTLLPCTPTKVTGTSKRRRISTGAQNSISSNPGAIKNSTGFIRRILAHVVLQLKVKLINCQGKRMWRDVAYIAADA